MSYCLMGLRENDIVHFVLLYVASALCKFWCTQCFCAKWNPIVLYCPKLILTNNVLLSPLSEGCSLEAFYFIIELDGGAHRTAHTTRLHSDRASLFEPNLFKSADSQSSQSLRLC